MIVVSIFIHLSFFNIFDIAAYISVIYGLNNVNVTIKVILLRLTTKQTNMSSSPVKHYSLNFSQPFLPNYLLPHLFMESQKRQYHFVGNHHDVVHDFLLAGMDS